MFKMLKHSIKDQLDKFNNFNKQSYKANYQSSKILISQLINLLSVNHKLRIKFNNLNKIILNQPDNQIFINSRKQMNSMDLIVQSARILAHPQLARIIDSQIS